MKTKIAAALLLASGLGASANVSMPAIFGDHMVLQQGQKLPVWGTADPAEKVTVSISGHTGEAVAGKNGKWRVDLDPLVADGKPVELDVEGKNKLVFQDVLAGEVWLCSGQSNMEFGIQWAHNASEVIPSANYPQIRLFMVARKIAFTPQSDCTGSWVVCAPQSVAAGGWHGFSAVAFFFGRALYEERKVPVGLIQSVWGGTPAQSWTSFEALAASPVTKHYADEFTKVSSSLPQLKAQYDAALPKEKQAIADWQKQYGDAYAKQIAAWNVALNEATQSHQPPPPKPQAPVPEPHFALFAGDDAHQPSTLFNGMIQPLIPFGIKGVIWYQGEANSGSPQKSKEYETLFPDLITDWRQRWGEGDFPFLFVQLASFDIYGRDFQYTRNAQLKTLALPNTGMAVAIDIGEPADIHPKDKMDVGLRLALAARHVAYGEDIVYSGPTYDSAKIERGKLRLGFKNVGGGLVIDSAPPIRLEQKKLPPEDHLEGFEIAGADGKFVPAQAAIDGRTVLVWNDAVQQPQAARYGWAPFPKVNLYNKEGLPASPFSTESDPK